MQVHKTNTQAEMAKLTSTFLQLSLTNVSKKRYIVHVCFSIFVNQLSVLHMSFSSFSLQRICSQIKCTFLSAYYIKILVNSITPQAVIIFFWEVNKI